MKTVPLVLAVASVALVTTGLVMICAPAVFVAAGILAGRIAFVLDAAGGEQ